MSSSILVVEDDPSIVLGLRLNLRNAGFEVRAAPDGVSGLAELDRARPDLVVLDLMLPGLDGLEVLRRIRARDPSLPVVVVTALGSETDKVKGLDLGATDYVTKPFSIAELLARIRACLRTAAATGSASADDRTLRAGPIELDVESRRVLVEEAEVDLTTKELDLLRYLMERPERVLTREQILAGVWGADYEGTDRTVDNFVSSLRKKLGDEVGPRHLRTVWGIGYRFVP